MNQRAQTHGPRRERGYLVMVVDADTPEEIRDAYVKARTAVAYGSDARLIVSGHSPSKRHALALVRES